MENYLPFISWVFFFGIFWLSKYHFELGPQSDRAIWLSPDALIWTFCWTNLSRCSALNRSSETFIYFLSLSVKSAVQIEPKWRATFKNDLKNSSLVSFFLEKKIKITINFLNSKIYFLPVEASICTDFFVKTFWAEQEYRASSDWSTKVMIKVSPRFSRWYLS